MHEWGIALEIIKSVEKEIENRKEKRVVEIFLRIGLLNNIVKEQLLDAFEIAKQSSNLKEAKLTIEDVLPKLFCNNCKNECFFDPPFLICPKCGSFDVKLLQGDELELFKITLEQGGINV